MNIAYSYVRFSSGEQAKGDSERRQTAKFESYCQRNGLTAAAVCFTDRGRSGYKSEHLNDTGELRRFLRLIEAGDIEPGSTLVVESLDRLGRQDVEEAFGVFSSILGAGIRIVTLGDGEGEREYVKGGGMVPLIMSILEMSRAHGESKRKADLVGAAMLQKQSLARSNMVPIGNVCPLWLKPKQAWRDYATDGSAYEEIPEKSDVVRRVFEMAINGRGREVIAKTLNLEGVASFKGKTWGTSSIDKILKNRAVIGKYQPKTVQGASNGKRVNAGDAIADYYPAVVTAETFYRAISAIEGRRTAKATKQSVQFNVWQGVAKCENCSGALHVVNKGLPPKGRTYIHCCNARKGICNAKSIRLDQSEAVFRGMLVRLGASELVKDSSGELEKQLKATEGRLIDARKRLQSLEVLLIENPDSPTIGRVVARAEADVVSLERDYEKLKVDLATEEGIGWDTFFQRLDLVTYEGRAKANALLKRLGVTVQIGTSGYAVKERDRISFEMDFRDGEAGYLLQKGKFSAVSGFIPISQVGQWSAAEHAAQMQYDAIEDDGQLAGEY